MRQRISLCVLSLVLSLGLGCPQNGLPEAPDGLLTLLQGTAFEGTLTATDPDGDTLSFSIVSSPSQGSLTLTDASTGAFQFIPDPGQTLSVQFEFSAFDGKGHSTPAVVSIEFGPTLAGSVAGLLPLARGQVVASSAVGVAVAQVDAQGAFAFEGLAAGEYAVKAVFDGYDSGPATLVQTLQSELTWQSDVGGLAPRPSVDVVASEIDSNAFIFHWEEDDSIGGAEYSSHVNEPVEIEFVGETLERVDAAAAQELEHDYNIVLSDEGLPWTQEHATRLLETMRAVPQTTRSPYGPQTLPMSKWVLVDGFLPDDVVTESVGSGRIVSLSAVSFDHSTPRVAVVEGRRGHFYSRRLHHALVRVVTDGGQDQNAVERILNERFGVSSVVPDYGALTATTTAEAAARFQSFHPNEFLELIDQFEEMPQGMHVTSGLMYLVRRLDGTPHPLYDAPAVAWPDAGYIEFMESAFTSTSIEHTHRLVIHEKAHFLWAHLFSPQLRADWITLGGWQQDPADPDGWTTSLQTEFVSAYAHAHNPNEDMAESISYFVMNPDKLRSRSLAKYEFLRDRVMQGSRYFAQIRSDLTFEVYNLDPDYLFPGKIRRVDIRVDGEPTDDKLVTVEIELHALDAALSGAQYAYMRVFSEIGTFTDVYLNPVDAAGLVLRGSFPISRYAKHGFWRTDQIIVTDAVGNQRFEGVNDFGWKLFVDSPLEDLFAPRYVPGTAALSVRADAVSFAEPVQIVRAEWDVDEDRGMQAGSPCYASLVHGGGSTHALESHGPFDEAFQRCSVEWVITKHHPSGAYLMSFMQMDDSAGNTGRVYLTGLPGEESARSVILVTADPDLSAPALDLGRITVTAQPTQPAAPNGETLVNIVYYARDDRSGLGLVRYSLRDPQEIEHGEYHYHANTYTLFFEGDPTVWTRYQIDVLLPQGSAPGIWGLSSFQLRDKVGNFESTDFVEILHFDVE